MIQMTYRQFANLIWEMAAEIEHEHKRDIEEQLEHVDYWRAKAERAEQQSEDWAAWDEIRRRVDALADKWRERHIGSPSRAAADAYDDFQDLALAMDPDDHATEPVTGDNKD